MAIDQIAATSDGSGAKPPIQAFNDGDGPSFSDLLDILNPLQHIPIINSLYQHLTGDSEGAVADVAGGTLWAGPVGLIGSLLDLSLRADTGKSVSDTVLGWLGVEDDQGDAVAQLAASQANDPASPAAAALQQTAAAALPPPVVVQNLPTPRSRPVSDKPAEDKDRSGPLQMGDFLVFGATGSAQPRLMTPALPSAPPASSGQTTAAPMARQGDYMVFGGRPGPTANPQSAALSSAAAPAAGGVPQRQGDFMIFGATPPAAAAAPPPVQTASAAPAGPIPLTPPARSYSVPQRRNPVVPATLPPPTTGPAALPGHGPSQAVAATSSDDSWFVNALNAGLDKYQAAQKLSQNDLAVEAGATLH